MKPNNIKYFIYTLVFIVTQNMFPQSWQFIGGPQGIYSNDIMFTRSGKLISVTYDGVFVSDNFGDNWERKEVKKDIGVIHKIYELIDGNIVGISELGIVLSEDTCKTWKLINKWSGLNFYGAAFIMQSPIDSALYLGRGDAFYRSKNKGYDWSEIWRGYYIDGFTINSVGTIFLGVRPGYIMKSTDNGNSFKLLDIFNSSGDGSISNLYANNSGGIYFMSSVTSQGEILHYENNTLTNVASGWLNPPLGLTSTGHLIYKSGNCLMEYDHATGYRTSKACQYFVRDQLSREVITFGDVWIGNFESESLFQSKNGGVTWKDIQRGHGYKPVISIEILPYGKILAGTFGSAFWGALYKSTNDGQNWSRVQASSLDAYFVDISSLANNRLIANGSYGAYVSDNGGDSWYSKSGISLAYSQYVSKRGTIFVGNDYKGIYLSRDNGNTWKEANEGIQHSYFFNFGESRTGKIFAGAWPNGVYSSANDGLTWQYLDSDLMQYNSMYCMVYKGDTLYTGSSSGLLRSYDDGLNWEWVNAIHGSVKKMVISNNGDLVTYLTNKGLYCSSDNGKSWIEMNEGMTSTAVYDMQFDQLGRLFVSTDSGIFRLDKYLIQPYAISPANESQNQSINISLTWNRVPAAKKYLLSLAKDSLFTTSLLLKKETTATEYQLVSLDYSSTYFWKTEAVIADTISITTEVNKFSTSAPSSFNLRQNYPNPFNIETTIMVDISNDSQVELSVFDLLGQKITELTNKYLTVGTHNYHWNGGNCASGLYFIILKVNDFTMIKKAILLK